MELKTMDGIVIEEGKVYYLIVPIFQRAKCIQIRNYDSRFSRAKFETQSGESLNLWWEGKDKHSRPWVYGTFDVAKQVALENSEQEIDSLKEKIEREKKILKEIKSLTKLNLFAGQTSWIDQKRRIDV